MNNEEILSNFVSRLVERAAQCEGLDYIEGHLLEALKSINIQSSDLAFLAKQTKLLEKYIEEHNAWQKN